MSVDVYDDHIRFQGYHVPLDTSKLPATTRDNFARTIQEAVDEYDNRDKAISDAAFDASEKERERVVDLIQTELQTPTKAAQFAHFVSDAASHCASLVTDNLNTVHAETDPANLHLILKRWFENELTGTAQAIADEAIEARLRKATDFMGKLG